MISMSVTLCSLEKTNLSLSQDAKKAGPGQHMSPGVAMSVSIQTLEGLRELHQVGWLHRWGDLILFFFPGIF